MAATVRRHATDGENLLLTRIFLLTTLLLTALSPAAMAAERRSFIRDAEVENSIRDFATPLFQAAGLDPKAVSIHIIIDPTLNAFVAGGQHMFIHTGLLTRVENVNQLIGVMAHETGHIAGGHLVRMEGQMENASTAAIVGMLLGAAVGAASGRGDAATAVMAGSQEMAMRNILAYSRAQESAADQAGLKFLDGTQQSGLGMLEFMELLGDQELLVSSRQDPYVRTHPLTRDRVAFIREWVDHSAWKDTPARPEFVEPFRRMRAKLFAFLEPPVRTFQRYKEGDNSIEARYARAIAAYRKPDLATALPLIDGLIAERPRDPFFYELKGQMLFENARGSEALEPYRRAVELYPDSALLEFELGQVEIEQNDPKLLKAAEYHLTEAVHAEPESSMTWKFLGIVFGREGDEGMANYAMAEQAMLEGRIPDARFLAGKAETLVPKGTPVWLRIQDIKSQAAQVQRNQQQRR